MKKLIISNNPDVQVSNRVTQIECRELSFMQVLYWARDLVHKGHVLLSHPLCGSLKPNETPYKSILLSLKAGETLDNFSLSTIEYAIQKAEKFPIKERRLSEKTLKDFRFIDKCLIESALNSDV